MQNIKIVIPCYNEQSRLPVETILSYLKKNENVSVLLVDDGSRDNTRALIESAAARLPSRIQTLSLDENSGKAEAIRQGMLSLILNRQADWFGYWDADLATPLEEIQHLLDCAAEPVQLLMCSRVKRSGARIERYVWRHFAGRCMAALIAFTLKLPVYDTQCGAKLIRASAARQVFGEPFLTKWLFDVELIARINLANPNREVLPILEVPIKQWTDIPGSKLKVKHMFSSLGEIVRIYRRYHAAMVNK
jgi:glycosyltransferase involved in cell wall biosynthesis